MDEKQGMFIIMISLVKKCESDYFDLING